MAAFAIVILMFGLAVAIAASQDRLVASLKANTKQVKRWGGAILILVGRWLIILAIWANALTGVFNV